MGTQKGHNVPFSSLVMKRIKQIYKIFKTGRKKKIIKKTSCHLVPKVVIDLPFEGRKVEGSRKYRRERVPKAGSKREETINEPINSCIGELARPVIQGRQITVKGRSSPTKDQRQHPNHVSTNSYSPGRNYSRGGETTK